MTGRQSAFDFPPPPTRWPRTNHLFLALKPPLALGSRIAAPAAALARQLGVVGNFVQDDRLHISLLWCGGPGSERWLPDLISRRMAGFTAAPIPIAFDRLSCFGGNSIVLRGGLAQPITSLRCMLLDRLSGMPVARQARTAQFEPHMTAFYSKDRFAEQPVEPRKWFAREVLLIHSNRGHRHLAAWPLAGEAHHEAPISADPRAELFEPGALSGKQE